MKSQDFLEGYGGQTTEQLLALASVYRIDSIVLAFEGAIGQKAAEHPISPEEGFVLAIEALERDVNHDGYCGFFLNSWNNSFVGTIVPALHAIGCPTAAQITQDAITALGLGGEPTPRQLEEVILGDERVLEQLEDCDRQYYGNDESIEDRLFDWIGRNRDKIRVGPA